MEELITGPFASVLEAHRGEMNAAVASARRSGSDLDLAQFTGVLRSLVAPIVEAVDATGQGFTDHVGRSLFDITLGLCGQRRMDKPIRRGWRLLLPALARELSADPYRVVAAVTNALANLAATPGARPDEWIRRVTAAAPCCADTDELLRAGQVAAWRAGMAMYREDALAMAAAMSDELLGATLGATRGMVDRLTGDPWFDPGGAPIEGPLRVGGFRGFGGAFLRPPTVVAHGGRALALDDGAGEVWFVLADAFGSAVVRYGADHGPPVDDLRAAVVTARDTPPPAALAAVPELTSWAETDAGLVATSALTHAVIFLRPSGGERTGEGTA